MVEKGLAISQLIVCCLLDTGKFILQRRCEAERGWCAYSVRTVRTYTSLKPVSNLLIAGCAGGWSNCSWRCEWNIFALFVQLFGWWYTRMWCFILERYTLVIQSLLLFGRHDAILFLGACQQFDEQYPGTQTRTRRNPKANPATLFHVFHFSHSSPPLPTTTPFWPPSRVFNWCIFSKTFCETYS